MAGPTQRVGGVVLAAGRSTRMGRPKALLPAGDRSFVTACVEALRDGGCDPVVVVVGGDTGADAAAEAEAAGAGVVWNRDADSDQLASLRIGVERLETLDPGSGAAMVLPVDHPLVASSTVRVLRVAGAVEQGAIARPVRNGRPGHPTLFPRSVWARLADPTLARGARSLVEADDTTVVDVPVEDDGAVTDIDTPEAYRRAFGRSP